MLSMVLSLTALGLFVVTSSVWLRRLSRVSIPDDRHAFLLGWGGAVLLGVAGVSSPGGGWISGTLGAFATLGGAAMLGLYAFGTQRAPDAIAVGQRIPEFSAPDEHGNTFRSTSLAGDFALIKFFRGHW